MDHDGKLIDIKIDPSPRDLRIFAGLWCVFFVVMAKIAFFTDRAVVTAAVFTSTMFLISLALNRDYPRRSQLWGLLIPGFLWSLFAGERAAQVLGGWWAQPRTWQPWEGAPRALTLTGDHAQWAVLWAVLTLAVVGGVLIVVSRSAGRAIYRAWMFAALPIGWTVSHLILAVVYFGVLLPVGLAMRLAGHDPMQRRFDPRAESYWLPHRQETDPKRYFRQF